MFGLYLAPQTRQWQQTVQAESHPAVSSYQDIPQTDFTCAAQVTSSLALIFLMLAGLPGHLRRPADWLSGDQQAQPVLPQSRSKHSVQVFHYCQPDGRMDSFFCPNLTLFNQQYFVCDW